MISKESKTNSTVVVSNALELGVATLEKVNGGELTADSETNLVAILATELNNELNNREA